MIGRYVSLDYAVDLFRTILLMGSGGIVETSVSIGDKGNIWPWIRRVSQWMFQFQKCSFCSQLIIVTSRKRDDVSDHSLILFVRQLFKVNKGEKSMLHFIVLFWWDPLVNCGAVITHYHWGNLGELVNENSQNLWYNHNKIQHIRAPSH